MTLDQLEVLQKIVKTGSFRAASQELHKAQSALSYSIRTLEDELGFSLFSREHYRPRLTPEGRSFLAKAEGLLQQQKELTETAAFLKRGYEPILRLAVSALWPLPYLVEALKELRSRYPQTEIKIIQDVLSIDEQLLGDKADLALGHVFNDQSLLITEEIVSVSMVAVCSSHHPLSRHKGKASENELKKFPQVITSSTLPQSTRSMGILNPGNVISVQDFATKKALLEGELGWGNMPDHLVQAEIKSKKLMKVHAKSTKIPLHIARHSGRELGPCGNFLWQSVSRRQKRKSK